METIISKICISWTYYFALCPKVIHHCGVKSHELALKLVLYLTAIDRQLSSPSRQMDNQSKNRWYKQKWRNGIYNFNIFLEWFTKKVVLIRKLWPANLNPFLCYRFLMLWKQKNRKKLPMWYFICLLMLCYHVNNCWVLVWIRNTAY